VRSLRRLLGFLCFCLSSLSLAAGFGIDHDWLWLVLPLFAAGGKLSEPWTPARRN